MNDSDLNCKCCGEMGFDVDFVNLVRNFMFACNVEIGHEPKINSGYRCSKHNEDVSEDHSPDGPHTEGAIDVQVYGWDCMKVIKIALAFGFTGIGINQQGPFASRFVHLDKVPAIPGRRPRPWVWSY